MITIDEIKKQVEAADSPEEVSGLWQKYLGKNGLLKIAVKSLKELSEQERREQGPVLQETLKQAEELIKNRQADFFSAILESKIKEDAENLTNERAAVGHLHPITETIREMNKLFISMGYSIMEEREIETDEFCFKRLNVPDDHSARDMQDTIYIEEPNLLLRTQTSSIEARTLANFPPPFKIVAPGRVYRNEKVNKSNHFIFHHYQGVVVGENITMKDLFSTLAILFKKMYGEDVIIRFRNKYYPEVEPGVGPDMQCFACKGQGCSLCKGVGWIEMGGAGMIHPNILKMAGIDNKKYFGFAFGLGLDRWVMAKYKIGDIRTFLGGNLAYKPYQHESHI